jgi:hypothetical protein
MTVHLPVDVEPMPVHGCLLVEVVGELRRELVPLSHPEGGVHVGLTIPLGAIGPHVGSLAGQNLDTLLLGADVHGVIRGVQSAHHPALTRLPQLVLEVIQLGRI